MIESLTRSDILSHTVVKHLEAPSKKHSHTTSMHTTTLLVPLLGIAALYQGAAAYKNEYAMMTTYSCAGSYRWQKRGDCEAAIKRIDSQAIFTDGAEFSVGTCYIKYSTDDGGPAPVIGEVIHETAWQLYYNYCAKERHGSFGTDNCDGCHVTVNYRHVDAQDTA
ncbi:MAG: hypothetical protein Q9181_004337 [Wetmoreana brouardii]